ncbi:hypothetical protein AMJ86_01005 [bacterium SM23_57]|nr:MAG: hypothetical protein AMJ86_01005 [bacterium SM23_57]
MVKKRLLLFLVISLILLFSHSSMAQPKPHGSFDEERSNIHSGNQIRTTFYNNGFVGRIGSKPEDIGGEYPINSGHEYIGDMLVMVGAEITDIYGETRHSVVTPRGPQVSARTGDKSSDGSLWYTWEALPGYANPDTTLVAMTDLKDTEYDNLAINPLTAASYKSADKFGATWPDVWPDRMGDLVDPGWPGKWNGYFGKNYFNADQESFYVMDDYNDQRYLFYPDSTDTDRRGLGLQAVCRGFQWSQVLAQDVLFTLFDITNIGTTEYDKVVFATIWGGMVGGDGEDDSADFDKEENVTYTWDFDGIGQGGWTPVYSCGTAFLESPGNSIDGIDNDGDGAIGTGPTININTFQPKTIQAGDPVVIIDYTNYRRTLIDMPDSVVIQRKRYRRVVYAGSTVEEIPFNGLDDNLDGLIDENNGAEVEIAPNVFQTSFVYDGLKYKDWLNNDGLDNPLIDERRDDGIDNDGDWSPLADDVGLDGQESTGDPGEGDGMPTSGLGTDLPGEPHIDKTDIKESDQLGLTSFYFFFPFNKFSLRDDEQIWSFMQPGYFNSTAGNVDGDFIYGSGYFPLKPRETERISVAILFGRKIQDLIRTKQTVQKIYDENYNFAKAPVLPTVWAVAGDNEVTLYWDDKAELSRDVLSGYDFEGYKIYRASDPGFQDALPVTDAFGSRKLDAPIEQFDKKNGITGFFPTGFNGAQFYLGEDTGLRHTYHDTSVLNGLTYFYAVTAYDRGEVALGIQPSETSKFATIDKAGNVETNKNVIVVTPNPPAAGYVKREHRQSLPPEPGVFGTGAVTLEIVDETAIKDNHQYSLEFKDTATDGLDNDYDWNRFDDVGADGLGPEAADYPGPDVGEGDGAPTPGEPNVDWRDPHEIVPVTSGYTIIDITGGTSDTLIDVEFTTHVASGDSVEVLVDRTQDIDGSRDFFDGLRLNIDNDWKIQRIIDESGWSPTYDYMYSYTFIPYSAYGILNKGVAYPVDYRIVFTENVDQISDSLTMWQQRGTSVLKVTILPTLTNFYVIDGTTDERVKYAFLDYRRPADYFIEKGRLSANDQVIFFEESEDTTLVTWKFALAGNDTTSHKPTVGDTFKVTTTKPFRKGDTFVFSSKAAEVDAKRAAIEMDSIKVVPNPYIAGAIWEPKNPFDTGRGDREIHFTHLPMNCTIRIYTIDGELLQTLEHHGTFNNGTKRWDMLTRDKLDIAYGVYIYHIDAPGIGEKVGKFAVIK